MKKTKLTGLLGKVFKLVQAEKSRRSSRAIVLQLAAEANRIFHQASHFPFKIQLRGLYDLFNCIQVVLVFKGQH